MAGTWVHRVSGLNFNGEAVGGLATIGYGGGYRDVVVSSSDDADGVEDVDRGGLRADWNLSCADVAKVNAMLDAAVGDTTYSGVESGADQWHDYTVPGLVATGMSLNLAKNADGVLNLNGAVRFADGSKTLSDIFAVVLDAAGGPTFTYPVRLYRPHSATFNPTGASPDINPAKLESVNLALTAEEVLEDYSDDDVCMSAVDVTAWGALQVSMVFKDESISGGTDMCAKLIDAAVGVLTVALKGRAGAADKTLKVENMMWTGFSRTKQRGYWEFTADGTAGWYDGTTRYTMNAASKLFSIT